MQKIDLGVKKALYKIATKQHAINALYLQRDSDRLIYMAISINRSAKTATPTVLINHDIATNHRVAARTQDELYESAQVLIRMHEQPCERLAKEHRNEQRLNAALNMPFEQASAAYPELRPILEQTRDIQAKTQREHTLLAMITKLTASANDPDPP